MLDLFAGSGSLGLEALSRGARSVCFVDVSRAAQMAIQDNLRNLEPSDVRIIKQDAFEFLRKNGEIFGWIFCDPPYERVDYARLLKALTDSAALGPDSLLILESDRYHSLIVPAELDLIDQRKFGDTLIHFIRRRQPETEREDELPPAS